MKWRNISKRELEITMESGAQVYLVDKRPIAAKIPTNDNQFRVISTRRTLEGDVKMLMDMWVGNQPTRVVLVNDSILEDILKEK
jgi:hypothetical protein